jgi:hypothetical protein
MKSKGKITAIHMPLDPVGSIEAQDKIRGPSRVRQEVFGKDNFARSHSTVGLEGRGLSDLWWCVLASIKQGSVWIRRRDGGESGKKALCGTIGGTELSEREKEAERWSCQCARV